MKKTGHNIFRDKYVVHELAGEKAGLSDSVWKDVFSNSTVLPYRGDIATADDSSPFRMVTFFASTYGAKFDQFFFAVSDKLKILLRSFASNYIGSSGPGITCNSNKEILPRKFLHFITNNPDGETHFFSR